MVMRAPGGLGDDFERHGLDSVPSGGFPKLGVPFKGGI